MKRKIIIGVVILAVLAAAFFFGGRAPKSETAPDTATGAPTETAKRRTEKPRETPDATEKSTDKPKTAEKPTSKPTKTPAAKKSDTANPTATSSAKPTKMPAMKMSEVAKPTAAPTQDKYHTDPVPEGVPEPVEPQEVYVFEGTDLVCTLSVRCDTILNNLSLLDPAKREVVPAGGVIYAEREVVFHKGESVFDVTLREMQDNRIHFEFSKTPIYNSAYIEGINNIYEFDCGELSGWEYSVNGVFPNYGCSRYQLNDGDKIEWRYTCDLGRDIGGHNGNE